MGSFRLIAMCKNKMKYLIVLTVFVSAFIFSVFIVSLSIEKKVLFQVFTQPTNLCAALENRADNTQIKDSSYVHIKGYLSRNDVMMSLRDINQNQNNFHCTADVEFVNEENLSIKNQKLIREIRRLTGRGRFARVKVEIIGTLEEREVLVQSQYVITPTYIKFMDSLEVLKLSDLPVR
jgi:hypothetical protein